MTTSNVSPGDLQRAMEEMRLELERYRQGKRSYEPGSVEEPLPGIDERDVLGAWPEECAGLISEPFPMDCRGYHIDDFLGYHDRDFVRNAYLGILKREPDPEGERHYLEMLRGGIFSKEEILGQLRYSREGRAKKVPVQGLGVFRLLQFVYRIPVLGYFTQLVVGIAHLPRVLNNLRRIDTDLHGRVHDLRLALEQTRDGSRAAYQQLHGNLQLIREHLKDKADIRLIELLETVKADRTELLDKADATDLQRLENEINSKAGIDWVKDQLGKKADIEWMEQLIADKADAADLAQKADIRWVEEELENKADVHWVQYVAQREPSAEIPGQIVSPTIDSLLSELGQRQGEIVEQIAALLDRNQNYDRHILNLRRGVVEQERRLRILLHAIRSRSGDEGAEDLGSVDLSEVPGDFNESYYVSFEDQFRGTREDIKSRAEVYLPPILELGIGGERSPVVDLGCGRGELLELFRENDLTARGVDSNQMMVRESREWGIDIVHDDACNYLRHLSSESVGAITALHLIEHLEFSTLLELIDESFRVLTKNGLLILETPNPKNILVGACDFYIDPTHRSPIHPDAIRYIVESRGFEDVRVFFFDEQDGRRSLLPAEQVGFETLDDYFKVSRDFTVLAYKNRLS